MRSKGTKKIGFLPIQNEYKGEISKGVIFYPYPGKNRVFIFVLESFQGGVK